MHNYTLLTVVFVIVTAFDLLFAVLSLKKKNALGYTLGVCCLGAAFVTAAYLISIYVADYFLYSVFSSLYFMGIDVALFALLLFVRHFTQPGKSLFHGIALKLIAAYTLFDLAVLAINPFHEIAITYIYERMQAPHYGYQMHLFYQLHLMLAYIYILAILSYLARKIRRAPSVYRRQYTNCVWILILVVLINVVYLYYQSFGGETAIDYSLFGYSLAAFLFYWNGFVYSEEDMLNRLKGQIFQNLGQGVLLFDYDNDLILENERAVKMFKGTAWQREKTYAGLLRLLEVSDEQLERLPADRITRRYSFQCYPSVGSRIRPVRCDYSPLMSRHGEILGKMFVFSDLSQEYDVLTGFHDWDSYKRREEATSRENDAGGEMAVACDINGLTDINRERGHSIGDQAIQALAQSMRENFPKGTVFVRGREAILVAVCREIREEQIADILTAITADLAQGAFCGEALNFQSAIQKRTAAQNREEMVRNAMDMLRTRKLLDQKSRHSAVLYSLVQALKECDKDTEAHVRRTQKLGERLGRRIGLTEDEQGKLALLAILHDIGKIGIPLDILNKPGRLTETEWEVIKSHVEKGYQITSSTEELRGISEMVLYHHERWDGKGYPDGLSKETIPLLSRIIAVVDAYDAMVNDRSYRRAMPVEQALLELRRCAGSQFDPTIVSEFLLMMKEENGIRLDDASEHSANAGARSLWTGMENDAQDGEDAEGTIRSMETPDSMDVKPENIHSMCYSRYIVGVTHQIVEVDEEFERMTGYSRQDVETIPLSQEDLIYEEDREEYLARVEEETKKRTAVWLEHRIRCKDGSPRYVYCYGRMFYDSAQRENRTEIIIADSSGSYSVQSVVRMEQSKALRRLERWENKYRRDPLTGLLNHEAFKNDVETRLLSGNQQAMMLMMDVDRFKEYNDTYGHRAGDEFLILVAQALLGTLRNDDFACRMGGDEFAAILFFPMNVEEERMRQRAAEICEKVNILLTSSGQGGTGLSMGGAFLSEDVSTFEQLYEASDQALYRSKESGRQRVSF